METEALKLANMKISDLPQREDSAGPAVAGATKNAGRSSSTENTVTEKTAVEGHAPRNASSNRQLSSVKEETIIKEEETIKKETITYHNTSSLGKR